MTPQQINQLAEQKLEEKKKYLSQPNIPDYLRRIVTVEDALDFGVEMYREGQKDKEKWAKALQSLTPGGSEYVDDPDRCVQTVKEIQQSQHKQIVKLTLENKGKKQGASPSGNSVEQEEKFHAVEYAGYWHIQEGGFYGDYDILNAEDVGAEEAERNAKLIVNLLNNLTDNQNKE